MADGWPKDQDTLRRALVHLRICQKCRSKVLADHQAIERQIREILNVLGNCRNIADRILLDGDDRKDCKEKKAGTRKAQKPQQQDDTDVKQQKLQVKMDKK